MRRKDGVYTGEYKGNNSLGIRILWHCDPVLRVALLKYNPGLSTAASVISDIVKTNGSKDDNKQLDRLITCSTCRNKWSFG